MTREAGHTCGDALLHARRRILWLVLAINATMFVVEVISGWFARSTALTADAVDFFGDSFTYALTLFVLVRSASWKSGAALAKAALMGLFGLGVLAATAYHAIVPILPDAVVISTVGTVALAANVVCAVLLFRYRGDDVNMRSVWLCSRNDAISNILVICAGLGVFATATAWPDIAVGAIVASLSLSAAWSIVRQVRGTSRPAPRAVGADGARR